MERLDKVLGNIGIGSRREIDALARRGGITVDGVVCRESDRKIDPQTCRVTVNGAEVTLSRFFYYMMNKPAGVLSATQDPHAETVLDLLSPEDRRKRLFPAGRLDRDTTGFLLLTNDGIFAHQLLAPKSHVVKRYRLQYTGTPVSDACAQISAGITIDGGEQCLPAVLILFQDFRAEIRICEGKFHQVKRMMTAVGCTVTALQRVAIGPVELDNTIPEGGYRPLTADELLLLKSCVSRENIMK